MTESQAIALLRACVERHGGNKAAAAVEVGISRASVSTLLSGTYPATTTERVEAKILAALDKRDCPAFGKPITGAACAVEAAKPMPLSDPAALKRWSICRGCDRNPQTDGGRNGKRS
ncbi:helix-turn-helix domain-containing protein [Rhodospirillum sp. A1_3_36]|uniref:helix-turn-helix domain-containing protein n=1 Tax=Rhodospirillum sp. A1_3_36 TaxID=3391666 RepID=UPI0039A73098